MLNIYLHILNFTLLVGVEIPNDQPLMKMQYPDYLMYPAATLSLNKHGYYSNIISKYL